MLNVIMNFLSTTGIANIHYTQVIMLAVSCVLLYLAIVKQFEPLLLLPIAFGMLLANLPLAGIVSLPDEMIYFSQNLPESIVSGNIKEGILPISELPNDYTLGAMVMKPYESYLSVAAHIKTVQPGGLLYYLGLGNKLGIFPPLIFLGVGSMTDFSPLIANPKSLLLGAAAQFGIFFTFFGAILLGFNAQQASSIGIIGGADGPTAIFLTSKLAPELLGPIAVAAYSYMALVPVIQPPIMNALTTKEERQIKMENLRVVTQKEKIIFPVVVTIVVSLILPSAATLIGMLMLGNLFKESGVVDRLSKASNNELMNIVTIFLGICVGSTATAEAFLTMQTIKIIILGVCAFAVGTAAGLIIAKIMNKFSKTPINPLIGSAGVSAVPMAARVSNKVGQQNNPSNFLLMHAMGPNVAGVIGSAVAAGTLLSLFG